ncbi:cytochrome P450 9e2-like [Aricia agestis]|uniref:cytochrome P450 9e2-like n=1 Tax=Aricia agestis TaxID=91739 RepID=UPI001C203B15|nr:cytochrome P450 9e2-like [Aricia agestis]
MDTYNGTKQIIRFLLDDWKLLTTLTVTFFAYFYFTSTFTYFKERGVKYLKPVIFFGNLWPRLIAKESFNEFQLKIYDHFKGERYGGIFEGRRPVMYILDPDLIKAITIRDFDHFVNRNTLRSRAPRYLERNILNLKDSEWKSVRSVITPTFSSFRLKNMFPLMKDSAQKLLAYLEDKNGSVIDVKQVMGYYTLDTIGTCAFGIDTCFHKNFDSEFIKAAEDFNKMSVMKRMSLLLIFMLIPGLAKYFNISFFNSDSMKVLMPILQRAKAERRSSESKRSDFLQLLIDAAAKEQEEVNGHTELDDDTIDAQALIFLVAGYETSSTLLSFAIHTLAVQPEIQQRLREHVRDVTGGEDVTYDHLAELDYLEGVLLETCRIYPPFARFDRVCVKPYTIPDSSVQIGVNDVVAIPVPGFHMDPKLFPEPEKFMPERFMREEKNNRPGHHFLGFGAGPRNCIGMRFSMVSMKLAMCVLLRNYKFSPCSKTEVPLKYAKRSFVLKTETGIWVQLDKI